MASGKAVIAPFYLKKNLSGKTISTSLYQQEKQVSIVFFPLSQDLLENPWSFAESTPQRYPYEVPVSCEKSTIIGYRVLYGLRR